jgi:hypothetical protein
MKDAYKMLLAAAGPLISAAWRRGHRRHERGCAERGLRAARAEI